MVDMDQLWTCPQWMMGQLVVTEGHEKEDTRHLCEGLFFFHMAVWCVSIDWMVVKNWVQNPAAVFLTKWLTWIS